MPANSTVSRFLLHGLLAAATAGLASGLLFAAVGVAHFGPTALAFAGITFSTSFLLMSIVIFPLMWLGRHLREPFYFLMMLLCGFFGGISIANLVMGNNLLTRAAWQEWIVVTYGATGAVCTLAAWLYLRWKKDQWHGGKTARETL